METVDRLRHVFTLQRNDLADHLAAGGAVDHAAYSKIVGAIGVLDMVLAELADIEKKQLEE
jgi:hypothetical protein